MFDVLALWVPILVAALSTYVASMIVWMVLPHHKSDYVALPDEEVASATLRAQRLKPGMYCLPHCADFSQMKDPQFIERMNQGPVGFLTIAQNGLPKMGKLMFKQFLFFLIGATLIAYVVSMASPADMTYMERFRLTSAVAFLAFGYGVIPEGIWYGRKCSTILKFLGDALLYALVVAGVFGWLWPSLS